MLCPKCKTENGNKELVCRKCGFKLKLKCPYCGNLNHVGAKVCQYCARQLLKICSSCKTINFSQAKVCRKCSAPFPPPVVQVETKPTVDVAAVLDKSASVAIELINISSIKNNIKSPEMSQKVIEKFYQIFAKAVKNIGLKPLKINESTLVVEFNKVPSFTDSIDSAVAFTSAVDRQLSEVSELLEAKLKVSYKVRYFISENKPAQKNAITSGIALGVVDDIIFTEEVYSYLKNKMLFKEIETSSGIFYKFLDQNKAETIVSDLPKEPPAKTRIELVSEMVNKIQMAQEGFVACLNGPVGVGKSNIFNALKLTFEEDSSNVWLMGQCSLQTKENTFFFFKDLLQNLFDIPAFNIDIVSTKQKIRSFLSDRLGITDDILINDIYSLLFYDEGRINNPIFQNKHNTYSAIAAIFRALLTNNAVVLQIEDIENIDHFSLEILKSLFDDGILKCNLKIFITSNIETDIIDFFASSHLHKDNTYFAQYPMMTKAEIDDFIQKAIGVREELGTNILNHIYENSQGLPVYVEEFLYSMLQLGLIRFTNDSANPVVIAPEINKISLPKNLQDIVQLRLTNISNTKPDAFKTLYYASILGYKFLPAVVQNILQLQDNTFQEIIKFLSMNNFIAPLDSYNYTFKSRAIWEIVRNLQLSEENRLTGVTSSMNTLLQLTMPDMSRVINNLISVKIPKYDILSYIEQATKDAYSIGDDYSYVHYKNMLLEAVQLSTLENKAEIILAIKEELLNLTYTTYPDVALKYADELLAHFELLNSAKTIEILGLMSVSFENTGNYLAAVECVDKSIERIDSKASPFATMLLNYSKLNSLLQLGRYEELVNLSQNAIFPVINAFYRQEIQEETSLEIDDVKAIELETMYYYSYALAMQGSAKSIPAIQAFYGHAEQSNNIEYTTKAQLLGGIIKLLQGESDELQGLLSSTQEVIPNTKDSTNNTLIWLILKNALRFFKGEQGELANELIMLSNFCLNVKQFALEPIVKGLLVKIALKDGNIEFAQNLAYELFYKCSNNQWAFGALLNWYMYCEIAIYKENYDEALKVAQNALDVAEKATINNVFFVSLIKLKIAEIYSLRNDCDMAKINASEAEQLADVNGYVFIKVMLGIVYYDILLRQIAVTPALKAENIKAIYKHLMTSKDAVTKLKNMELSVQINQKISNIEKYAEENDLKVY